MLSVASSLFGKSSTLSAYTLHSAGPSPSSSSTALPGIGPSSGRSSPAVPGGPAHAKPFNAGLWKVLAATHKTTGKDVSVWVFEKKVLDGLRSGRDYVVEQLKKEATALSRLRHPDILHMVEPLEESRSELTFVTETVTATLGNLIAAAKSGKGRSDDAGEVDLDEVEIQKGTLQIAKGLGFLHQQAKSVHLNLNPDAILINAKGDWKLSGLQYTTPLQGTDGNPTRAQYPEVDGRLPPQIQWKLDYLAPEYAIDQQLSTANDLYSLGCVLYAVHIGKAPFANRGSLQSLRENADGGLTRREYARGPRWERSSNELKDLLPRLLTRNANGRISLASLATHPFFSSLAISTLNFLDPTTFASKPREEKATFLRGLVRVLPTFSARLKKGKILLSLLEEMKDPYLLPFILPNVFEISKSLSKEEFATVLPKLQPLFALKDPPQNMLTLLENLTLFEEKTSPQVFREAVMPLIYNSLESEHLPVQERVLKAVPHLTEILDYGTVQNVLLVKVAILFTRTRILSVKVQTLECFRAMVATLDATTLTTKLVPLLAKIKTKEPAVTMATLSVQEAMGQKVSLEAIATLVLPQLWAMSMGPLLNADQFSRFMQVIKTLGARVEKEHSQHLREVRKMEEQTNAFSNGTTDGTPFDFNSVVGASGEVDFEALVKGQGGASSSTAAASASLDPWGDDGWGDSTSTPDLESSFPGLNLSSAPVAPASPPQSQSRATGGKLKARAIPSSSFNASVFEATPQPQRLPSFGATSPSQPGRTPSFGAPVQPQRLGSFGATSAPLSPSLAGPAQPSSGPNYNLSLQPQAPKPTSPTYASFGAPLQPTRSPPRQATQPSFAAPSFSALPPPIAAQPSYGQPLQPAATAPAAARPPPGWTSGLMQPTAAPKPAWGSGPASKSDWGDFDPLK
ncbi:Protein kinase domain-containing protein ppk32 [Vanrija pseudolonga]|uniref:Protein kinase domain-containing protein ppk32 n=1 Tax=Vanrija pseudolonga TaxID=143232 RepID=A0AAF1BQI4_9TREE|nr:Protein kinase domain-containing protein ppk32 [Vanrija pseudolonga]